MLILYSKLSILYRNEFFWKFLGFSPALPYPETVNRPSYLVNEFIVSKNSMRNFEIEYSIKNVHKKMFHCAGIYEGMPVTISYSCSEISLWNKDTLTDLMTAMVNPLWKSGCLLKNSAEENRKRYGYISRDFGCLMTNLCQNTLPMIWKVRNWYSILLWISLF